MSDERGLYDKYDVRKDGEPVEDCFVLEPENDKSALVAVLAYAHHTDNEQLCRDLIDWVFGFDEYE